MAFRYPECEFCANHGNHDLCDDCDEGDAFEDVEDRRRSKKVPHSKVVHMTGRSSLDVVSETPNNFQSIMKDRS